MSRPSIALCMIVKNEAHNLGPLLQSVRGCFDQIHITDTGSTDSTLEFIDKINKLVQDKNENWSGLPEIDVHSFEWVNDFSAARNASFSYATSDYVMWMDGDDVLSDAKAFINWRDNVLHSAHYWVAKYNYAFNDKGQVECEFIRERVVKNNYGFKWEFFVHEGLLQKEGRKYWPQRVTSWWIDHKRTEDDKQADNKRNLKIFELRDVDQMHPRMKFYYGKELFENGFQEKAGKYLLQAVQAPEIEGHDRILSIQYAAQSAFAAKAYPQAVDILMNGLTLALSRAEYWCLLGDIYQTLGDHGSASMAYRSALQCEPNDMGGVLVVYRHAYAEYPHMQLATIALNSGDHVKALPHIESLEQMKSPSAESLRAQFVKTQDLSVIRTGLTKSGDVIITCPPGGAVTDWDENTLAVSGHGGSETAAIEVARLIKEKTGRKVKVFQPRKAREVMPSGVEYLPIQELQGYLHNIEPKANINWRHAVKITNAPSYVWCHDLQCPGADKVDNYDKIIALSGFHAKYLQETNGVPADKIMLGFNGIDPSLFSDRAEIKKDPLKVVFSSSPDRGLVQTIDIVKKARELSKLDIKLHCFYGVANMRKMGHTLWADQIEAKIKENDFVIYHGNVEKQVLMDHFMSASVWLYPADFIETYCITAIEALCAGVWPIVRAMGALPYTMKEAIDKGMCDLLDVEVTDEASVGLWANTLVEAIIDAKWQKVDINPYDYSWDKVADLFISEMELA